MQAAPVLPAARKKQTTGLRLPAGFKYAGRTWTRTSNGIRINFEPHNATMFMLWLDRPGYDDTRIGERLVTQESLERTLRVWSVAQDMALRVTEFPGVAE